MPDLRCVRLVATYKTPQSRGCFNFSISPPRWSHWPMVVKIPHSLEIIWFSPSQSYVETPERFLAKINKGGAVKNGLQGYAQTRRSQYCSSTLLTVCTTASMTSMKTWLRG